MRNHAASVRAKLLGLAHDRGEDFQRVLIRYAIERFLYRISRSGHSEDFVLKGATLFALWLGQPHRPTKDLDLLGRGEPDIERLVGLFRAAVAVECPEDGIAFDAAGIAGALIREDALYGGIRVQVPGQLAGARFKIQVDVGLGDAVVPKPAVVEVPSLLDLPSPRLLAYARETVVAEKLEALVILGLASSRMKDFYDLALLHRTFPFDDTLVDAVRATFSRRGTPFPANLPSGLSDEFAADEVKRVQWRAFLKKVGGGDETDLGEVVVELRAWLWPVLQRAGAKRPG